MINKKFKFLFLSPNLYYREGDIILRYYLEAEK